MDLEELRKQIDEIDTQMCDLFAKRMQVVSEVGRYKKENNLPVYHPSRARTVLHNVSRRLGPEFEGYGRTLYRTIFDLSESYETRMLAQGSEFYDRIKEITSVPPQPFPKRASVACAGCEGSYAHLASERLFDLPDIMYMNGFEGVFKAVSSGLCEYGVLPIENSLAGSVNAIYDLLSEYNVSIVRGVRLKVDHALLGVPGAKLSEIREIYSHQQAISQCSEFLSTLKNVRVIAMENTAEAARMVAQAGDRTKASLSSRLCAELYQMQVLKSSAQNRDNNYTRFICIAKEPKIYSGADRTSVMINIPNRPGTLFRILSRFNATGVNLVKLESRLIPEREFEYRFYFDIEASVYSTEFLSLMCELHDCGEQFKYFGTYAEII
ncbi:MAG: chorismate mutase [Bacteroidaceae bacterium]|nr:chorismate mutase [Bacteroidaceae bacterium]